MSVVMPPPAPTVAPQSARPWSAKDARAVAKAAAARNKELRPWYRKKRYIFSIAIIAIIAIAVSQGSNDDTSSPGQTTTIESRSITTGVPVDAIVKIKTISRLAST